MPVPGNPLPSLWTETFARLYNALSSRDARVIDELVDALEVDHAAGHMRNVIHIGDTFVYATQRAYAPGGVYRVTWQYDDSDAPTALVCITVAEIET